MDTAFLTQHPCLDSLCGIGNPTLLEPPTVDGMLVHWCPCHLDLLFGCDGDFILLLGPTLLSIR